MDILKLRQKIDDIENKYNIKSELLSIKDNCQIISFDNIKDSLNEINKDSKLLRIGIIGRVKAGKSSLLNALVFDGNNVLPEAATPMTAALTIIKYSDTLSATVDIFSDDDINELKNLHKEYLKKFDEIKKECYEYLIKYYSELEESNLSPIRIKELKLDEKATQEAKKELEINNLSLHSSYEQYEFMQKAKKPYQTTIEASNLDELKLKLQDYVGVNGIYTHYTKSITLYLNEPRLQGLEIIDTPGVCDPVQSRGTRTTSLIKSTHVCFIISPSGQFLNTDDIKLMGQVYGANETSLYVVASKIDTQLRGVKNDNKGGNLDEIINIIKTKHNKRLKQICNEQDIKEKTQMWQKLLQNEVITSSGMAYKILKNLPKLSEEEEYSFSNYKSSFNDDFNDVLILQNLKKLANIDSVLDRLNECRVNKDNIIKQKNKDFIKIQSKNLDKYKDEVIQFYEQKIKVLHSSGIKEIKENKEKFTSIKSEIKDNVDRAYKDSLDDFDKSVKNPITTKFKAYFKSSTNSLQNAEKIKTTSENYAEIERKYIEPWYRKLGNFITFGLIDDYTYEEVEVCKTRLIKTTIVNTNQVYDDLDKLCQNIQNILNYDIKEYVNSYKKTVLECIRKVINNDKNINQNAINLDIIFDKFKVSDFSLYPPFSLNPRGVIENEQAKEYLKNAKDFLSEVEILVKDSLNTCLYEFENDLKKCDIGDEFLLFYMQKIEELELDLVNKETVINKYNQIIKEFYDI